MKDRPLTKGEKGFIKDVAAGETATDAAQNNFNVSNRESASSLAASLKKRPVVAKKLRTMADRFDDELIERVHKGLLNASRIDHMVFGKGPRTNKERDELIEAEKKKAELEGKEYVPIDYITDEDITQMLKDVNCEVRRISHRETGRDVYFWSNDNLARDKALDKVYKLKGAYAAEKKQLIIDPINPELKSKIDSAIDGILSNN